MENIDRAINSGDIEYVKAHLKENKISTEDFKNALLRSAENGHLHVVKYLVEEHQADIHACALRWSAGNGHLDVVKYLVEENNEDIHVIDECTLKWSAQNGHLEVVKYLVEQHQANIHAENEYALRLSAHNGYLDVVKYLVEKGANIHALDDTALKWCASNGHLEVVKYLAEKGADIHAGNEYALKRSAENGHLQVVKYLVSKGASLDKINRCIFIHFIEINAPEDIEFIVQYFPKTVPDRISEELVPKEFHEFCLKYGIVYQGSGYERMEDEYRKRKEIRAKIKKEIYEKAQEILYRPGGIRYLLMEARFYENAFGCTI